MTFSRGDVIWLRVDYLEGGVGKPHPAIVISSNEFNDSHEWGIIIRGSSDVPIDPDEEHYVIKKSRGNGRDRDTVFPPIVQSAKWTRVMKKVGTISPYQLKQLMDGISRVLGL